MRTNRFVAGIFVITIPAVALGQAPGYLSQRDVAEAQRDHPQIVAEFRSWHPHESHTRYSRHVNHRRAWFEYIGATFQ